MILAFGLLIKSKLSLVESYKKPNTLDLLLPDQVGVWIRVKMPEITGVKPIVSLSGTTGLTVSM